MKLRGFIKSIKLTQSRSEHDMYYFTAEFSGSISKADYQKLCQEFFTAHLHLALETTDYGEYGDDPKIELTVDK